MVTAPLHPQCESISFLLGTWRGTGAGEYPTIQSFEYEEEIEFWHIGKPFLFYVQKTRSASDGSPLHTETGYWRPKDDGVLEVVLAHSFGTAEICVGHVSGARIELVSSGFAFAHSAKLIAEERRSYYVTGDTLTYSQAMAAVGQPMTHHLAGVLTRD